VTDSLGAQLMEIKSTKGADYIWNGDTRYWNGRAPNLFPYVGRLTEQSYILNGVKRNMGIHGFARQSEFTVTARTDSSITYTMSENESTLECYPYYFIFHIMYVLTGNKLEIRNSVENRDKETMYFGLGGHPGFHVPISHDLEKGLKFEDYYLEFDRASMPTLVGISDDCFVSGHDVSMPLEQDRIIRLKHSLFDIDAIILKNMPPSVVLKSDLSSEAVTVSYPDMKYLGIWHKPRTDAPFVCIEPWTSLPSRKGVVEDFACQSDLIRLSPGAVYHNTWSIETVD